jgi:large subunit ribosomal protein L5
MASAESAEKHYENPMLEPRISKVVVNVSVGKSGEPLERAMKIIEDLTKQRPCTRLAKKTVRDFGIRKKEPIACVVTLRGEEAHDFLVRAFRAVDNRIDGRSFDKQGNFAFGIKEHIEIPGTKYSPDLGIIGMDISVRMERPGYRVKNRHRANAKVGRSHQLTPNESVAFIRNEFSVEVT